MYNTTFTSIQTTPPSPYLHPVMSHQHCIAAIEQLATKLDGHSIFIKAFEDLSKRLDESVEEIRKLKMRLDWAEHFKDRAERIDMEDFFIDNKSDVYLPDYELVMFVSRKWLNAMDEYVRENIKDAVKSSTGLGERGSGWSLTKQGNLVLSLYLNADQLAAMYREPVNDYNMEEDQGDVEPEEKDEEDDDFKALRKQINLAQNMLFTYDVNLFINRIRYDDRNVAILNQIPLSGDMNDVPDEYKVLGEKDSSELQKRFDRLNPMN
jgi:hypothetical protein